MNTQHVNKLLAIANRHLPSVQSRYDDLKRQVGSLEGQIRNSTMLFQDFTDQISYLHKTLADRKEILRLAVFCVIESINMVL